MTRFEELAKDMNISIETDGKGMFTGMTKALAIITTDIILSDDEEVFNMDWEHQKKLIKDRFVEVFPYKAGC